MKLNWVIRKSGTPTASDLAMPQGQGSALGIDTGTGSGYYLKDDGSVAPLGGGSWTLLATLNPNSNATYSFTSISQAYTHLRVVGYGRDSTAATGASAATVRFNSDSGANYNFQRTWGSGTTTNSARSTGQTSFWAGEIPKDSDNANVPGMFEFTIPGYSRASFYKAFQGNYWLINDAATTTFQFMQGGYWASTSAITQIDFAGVTWKTGSLISLYGIK